MPSVILKKNTVFRIGINASFLTIDKAIALANHLGTKVEWCDGKTIIHVYIDRGDLVFSGKDYGRVEVEPEANGFCIPAGNHEPRPLSEIIEKLNSYLRLFTWMQFRRQGEEVEEEEEPQPRQRRPALGMPCDPVYMLVFLSVASYALGLEKWGEWLSHHAVALVDDSYCFEPPGNSLEELMAYEQEIARAIYVVTRSRKHVVALVSSIPKGYCGLDTTYLISRQELIDNADSLPEKDVCIEGYCKSISKVLDTRPLLFLIRVREKTNQLLYGGSNAKGDKEPSLQQ